VDKLIGGRRLFVDAYLCDVYLRGVREAWTSHAQSPYTTPGGG